MVQSLSGRSLGRYHLVEQLGEGGMAMVYKAYDASLERSVAIKVIRTERGGDEAFLHRFRREAKALAQLDHPYILKILDYGEQDGMPYLVMPYLTGGTLKDRMGAPMPYMEAARSLAPVARALAYAHQQGIVHRDVKPANILITQSGALTLSDFGIAKIIEGGESTQLTATGVGIGTPDYMAPEQWLGKTNPQSDVYALGVVFFELVTGRRPYTADTPAAVLLKHMYDPLPRPSDYAPLLPEAVEGVIFKALAKEPVNRFADMDAFAAALEKLAAGLPADLNPSEAVTMDAVAGAAVVGAAGARISRPTAQPPRSAATQVDAAPGATVVTTGRAAPAQPARGSKVWLAVLGGGLGMLVIVFVLLLALGVITIGPQPPEQVAGQATQASGAAAQPDAPQIGITHEATMSVAEVIATITAMPSETPAPTATTRPPLTKIEGLPEDIPVFTDNNGDLMHQVNQGMDMYMYTTSVGVEDVSKFFDDEMLRLGWSKVSYGDYENGTVRNAAYEKDNGARIVQVNLVQSSDPVQVMIQILQMVGE